MAYNGNTLSLGTIVWKVLKNPLASELTYEDAAELTLEYIRLVGAPLIYTTNISEPIELKSYKACLPSNVLHIKGIKYTPDLDNYGGGLNQSVAMMHNTDVYLSANLPKSNIPEEGDYNDYQGFNYVIEKGIIKTSLQTGYVIVSYEGIATDEDGFPLVPDQEQFKLGLEYYILHRYLEPLWMVGKVTDKVFNYIEQQRHFYLASASNALQMPDVDQMEAIMNSVNRIITSTSGHANFFRLHGEKEQIKKYN
jgi:hypothetical protein